MPLQPPPGGVTITCNVRASSVVAPVDSTIETLQAYERRDVIDELAVETWPDEVVLDEADPTPPAVDRFRRYETWADAAGASIRPPFAVTERAMITRDEPRTILTLPVCCLAVRVDGRLELVAPHGTGESTYTVDDVLADLATLERAEPATTTPANTDRPPATPATPTPEDCPDCGHKVVTGQGVYACPSCAWNSLAEREEADTDATAHTPKPGAADRRVTPPAE